MIIVFRFAIVKLSYILDYFLYIFIFLMYIFCHNKRYSCMQSCDLFYICDDSVED